MSPKALETKPILYDWMIEYLEGFQVLSRTRSIGMALNPIPLTEIESYLRLYGSIDPIRFIRYICKMDSVYLDVMAKRSSGSGTQKPGESTDNGRQPTSSQRQRRPPGGNRR